MSFTDDQNATGKVVSGYEDEGVQNALELIKRNNTVHNTKENEWELIQKLFESGFEVYNPTGTKKISSKLLQQALWKLVNKMKPLDFQVHGSGRPENVEDVVSNGIGTVMNEGGFAQCFRDKGGIAFKLLLFGDSFFQLGTLEGTRDYPLQYRVCSLSDVYVDSYCTDVRDPTGGLSANEMAVIYRYSPSQFYRFYPQWKNKVAVGLIPRSFTQKQLEKDIQQDTDDAKRYIEVAHYWNISDKTYVPFAGAACTVLTDKVSKGDEYIYQTRDEEPYIPVFHFKCFPSSEGFYNYGIGQALYDLAVVMARMDNMAYNHAEENIWPISVVNVPKGTSSSFFNKLLMAHQQRAAGSRGYAVQEYDPLSPNATKFQIDSFQSQPITQEWERAYLRLEQQIKRLGIQLDAVDRGTTVTATQILSEEENADAVVKQIMEFNASESKFVVEVTLDLIPKTIDKNSSVPINSTTEIDLGDGVTGKMSGVTLGALADELEKNKYFVIIDSRSGAIPSNVMEQARVARSLQMLQPGSPAHTKILRKMMKLNNQDVTLEELSGQPAGDPAALAEASGQAVPSSTDRLSSAGTETPKAAI